ncbi:carbohydrate ABC transporter permease [Agromyces aerolatus]|uniref:carbohydrate ABC transporter permease n=1 Tax=Agromyces sp. LY-1074 TaxID=3074080 RepID=UPI002858230A|nr:MULTISPECIES: sugar ABC transporter permease [unclassified Agromyces]MDR5699727.1 sugar ABC transporter permease [Agromyces sp. LY-1074]
MIEDRAARDVRPGADAPRPARARGRRRSRFNSAYLFLLPAGLVLGVFVIYPLIATGWMSLHDWSVGGRSAWIGLDNYAELAADSRFWNAMRVTVTYTVVVVIVQIALSLAIAQALRKTSWFTALLRSAYYFPTIVSLAVVGVIWQFLLDPQIGLVNTWLQAAGIDTPDFLRDPATALPAIVVVGIWKGLGFTLIIILAGLQSVPGELYEAARIDGAGPWRQYWSITLPLLRPATTFATVIATVQSLQLFELSYVMTRGGPLFSTESVVMYLYQRGFIDFRMGYASAIAWVLFVVILAISFVQLRMMRYQDVD